MREIIFDTETTGFDPQSGDRMVEIGCIEMIDRVETGNSFHCYYNPQRPMPKAAEEVHGLSDIFLSDKKLFSAGADELLEFLGEANLVAHNAQFDFNFLNAELVLCGKNPISQFRMVDTLAIAKVKHPGAKLSLDALCSRYGIDRSHRVKHGALLDAELLTQLYIELTGGRQIGLSLADDKVDSGSDKRQPSRKEAALRRQFIAPRPHSASAEELAHHAAFMEGIEDPLWAKT
ncbi:DNA polymerase III subunit epsilon [Parasphingorhabdus cellanae]|uniref:DNA polymerase III subunit epsilon n=1 Tax=Parasphingorhabdus cellanae TaxID=2806553 RepID=A0ABX7SZQ8_9SPHN|nr:DNA polymerase III subunit epsilon [Parasphingorhabdus cellanae]QTD54745.1 DNA polymerase III subunit epsilon [Parasphingorhabdus cellanae]